MHVLLDECVPRPLRREISEHEVRTVPDMGWAGKKNGALLTLIKNAGFGAFVTTDQNLEYQQDLQTTGLGVIVLVAYRNTLPALLPLVSGLRLALERVQPGEVAHVRA